MTPADRILKAAHAEIDRQSALLNALNPDKLHAVKMTLKPRGDRWRVSMAVETLEETV